MGVPRRLFLCGAAAIASGATTARGESAGGAAAPWTIPAPPIGSAADELRIHTDWALLGQYRTDNLRVRQLPQRERQVVFLGDSITRAWRVFHPEFFMKNGYIDRGISGQATPQMLVRFRQDVLSLRPEVVHIMGGTNDVAENTGPFDPEATRNNLMSMVDLARLHRVRIILAAVPPAAAFPWRSVAEPVPKLRALNSWIRDYATLNNFAFADYTPLLDDGAGAMKPELTYDGVHPNRAGYLVMEQITTQAVAKALA
jgi:lysophospholipase L1-like esterase